MFEYAEVIRVGLVVSVKRGNESFISTRKNILIPCFELDGMTTTVAQIKKYLYKREGLANYYKLKRALGTLLGKSRFKTFNLAKMENLSLLIL